jgi:hypothetical protein
MGETLTLTVHQTIFALLTSLVAFGLVLELVRRRRLREEYAWLWLLTSGSMILLVVWFRLLVVITHLVGAVTPLNTLLLFAVLFLFAIAVHYSIIVSRLTTQVKNLAQELALVSARLEEPRR